MATHKQVHGQTSKFNRALSDHAELIGASLVPFEGSRSRQHTQVSARPPPGSPAAVDTAFRALVETLIPTLQEHLDAMQGKDFGDAKNLEFAKSVTRLLRHLSYGLCCPHCNKVARSLRFEGTNVSRPVGFRFEHDGNVKHGCAKSVPALKLAPRETE